MHAYLDAIQEQQGGFNFDYVQRNNILSEKGIIKGAKVNKTGTTIVGVIFNNGVVIGADTRATSGNLIADKNCDKLHFIAPNIYAAGAGTAADCQWVTDSLAAQLKLQRLNTNRQTRVSTFVTKLQDHLFKYQGHCGVALIVGGVDVTGNNLVVCDPNGYVTYQPYYSMGSGSLAAMGVLESKYKDDLTEEEARALVTQAVQAGIYFDEGSGSRVDLAIIRQDKTTHIRNADPNFTGKQNCKQNEPYNYLFPKDNTKFFDVFNYKIERFDVEDPNAADKMLIEK